jgi:hypothetical protein
VDKLKDIKGIVEVSDYSMYYLLGIIFAILLMIIGIIYLYKKPKRRKKPTSRVVALGNLKNINYANAKDTAYSFTLNTPFFINEKNRDQYESILQKLEIYKYEKEVPQINEDLKNEIQKYIGRLK